MNKITVLIVLVCLELILILLLILGSKKKRKEEFKSEYERKISEGVDFSNYYSYWLTLIAFAIVIVLIVIDLLGFQLP